MTNITWTLLTPPAEEPLSLVDAKNHLRINQANQDAWVRGGIAAARQAAENCLHRGLFTQTWQLGLPCFYEQMSLPMAAPLQNSGQAVPVVQYYDITGTLQTLSTSIYAVDTVTRPGQIIRAPSQTWPSLVADRVGAPRVLITYTVGWSDVALIPERIKQGMRVYLGMLDRNRDGFEAGADKAEQAAAAFWDDVVYWKPPTYWPSRQQWLETQGIWPWAS